MTAINYFILGYQLARIKYQETRCVDIVNAVCRYFGYEQEQLKRKARTRRISNARKVAMYLIRENTDMTYEAIGNLFSVHRQVAHRAYHEMRDTPDPQAKEEIEGCQDMLNALILSEYNQETPF